MKRAKKTKKVIPQEKPSLKNEIVVKSGSEKANYTYDFGTKPPTMPSKPKAKANVGSASTTTKTNKIDYSKAKSVNALVTQRTKWRANEANKGVKFPGQGEINKRLKGNASTPKKAIETKKELPKKVFGGESYNKMIKLATLGFGNIKKAKPTEKKKVVTGTAAKTSTVKTNKRENKWETGLKILKDKKNIEKFLKPGFMHFIK